jgi:hypothetical protein
MTAKHITDAVFDPDARAVHYFNGRLLSAEDLRAEQDFNHEERRHLAQAAGHGIAYGLDVRQLTNRPPNPPTISISAGIALTRSGETLHLPQSIELSLARPPLDTPTSGAQFAPCGDLDDTDAYIAGGGVYLLTMYPVEGYEGRAYASGLNNSIATCNNKYRVKGVRFRVIQFTPPGINFADAEHLRNWLAHRCFGTETKQAAFAQFPTTAADSYGLLDDLRPNVLTDCDVPLALLYWTSTAGLVFLDQWAVRRRITSPAPHGWSMFSDRRVSEREATLMQFDEQLADLITTLGVPNVIAAAATNHFRYLPPAGILPLATPTQNRGFDDQTFFTGITTRATVTDDNSPIIIEGARVESLLRASFSYPPIDLTSGVMVWLYRVRENMQSQAQPYLIFATGHMPYVGDPHYGVNRHNFGNFS